MNDVSPSEWTYERLEQLVRDHTEESLQLEFKGPAAASSADKISKSISSMANSAGGTVIFGIQEGPATRDVAHRALSLEPIDPQEVSKERFESLITGNIQPRLPEFVITTVKTPDDKGVFYIVEVPQSHTVHQAKGNKYYRRRNFTTEAMEDYEIREGMLRSTHPVVSADVTFLVGPGVHRFEVLFKNTGSKIAQRYALCIQAPSGMSRGDWSLYPQHTTASTRYYNSWELILPSSLNQRPLFPGQESIADYDVQLGKIQDKQQIPNKKNKEEFVTFVLFADEMPSKRVTMSVDELFFRKKVEIL